jgi:hypothetical protein
MRFVERGALRGLTPRSPIIPWVALR